MKSQNIFPLKGPCPACQAKLKDARFFVGSAWIVYYHEDDDFSGMTNDELVNINLCKANRITGQTIQRNYTLQGESK